MKKYLQQEDHDGDMRRFAHNLRNSMSVIYGNTQILEEYLGKKEMKKELKMIDKILHEIRKMNSLIAEELNESEKKSNTPILNKDEQ